VVGGGGWWVLDATCITITDLYWHRSLGCCSMLSFFVVHVTSMKASATLRCVAQLAEALEVPKEFVDLYCGGVVPL